MTDWIDTILAVGAAFDWISPIVNEVGGYRDLHFQTTDFEQVKIARKELKKRGISSKVEGSPLTGYNIYTGRVTR